MRKFRISETATGKFALEVKADPTGDDELWVPAAKLEFETREDAIAGITRIVRRKHWYFDEKGEPCR